MSTELASQRDVHTFPRGRFISLIRAFSELLPLPFPRLPTEVS